MFCYKCGNQIAEGANFCRKCGTKLKSDVVVHEIHTKNTKSNNKSAEELLTDSMIEAIAHCVLFAILGLLCLVLGIAGIFGICISVLEGVYTETFFVSLLIGVLLTPVSIVIIITSISCGKRFVNFKRQRKEAINNDKFIY